MNRDRIYLGIVTAMIIMVIIYASYGLLNGGKEELHYSVSVVIDNSGSDQWNAFKEGLNQGANESGIYLNIVSASTFSGLAEEYMILERELENGADGVITALCDTSDPGGRLEKIAGKNQIVLIASDLDLENGYALVQPDSHKIGRAIAEMVLKEKNVDGKTVGVVSGNQRTLAGRQRLAGFQTRMQEECADFTACFLAKTEAELEKEMKTPPDILVALDSSAMELALDYLQKKEPSKIRLYGEGRSERAVYCLDRGMIQGMVVQDEYAMGYESARLIRKCLEHSTGSMTQVETGFISVTKEEMHEKEAEKILFPTVH